jgi:molybdopterin adenylyltransferase
MSDATLPNPPKVGILTISDRASAGTYEDRSGPAIEEVLREYLATPCEYVRRMIPDEVPRIVAAIREFAAAGCSLICTTGGTGPAPRDVTPEAMEEVCEKMLPGFGEQMRRASLDAGVPTAILSRQTAGIVGSCLVVNVPGKPGSVRVCLDAVFPAIPYCIELAGGAYLEGNPDVVQVFRPKKG